MAKVVLFHRGNKTISGKKHPGPGAPTASQGSPERFPAGLSGGIILVRNLQKKLGVIRVSVISRVPAGSPILGPSQPRGSSAGKLINSARKVTIVFPQGKPIGKKTTGRFPARNLPAQELNN